MNLEKIVTQFEFGNKSRNERLFDTLISPFSYALGGKTVSCFVPKTGTIIDSKNSKQIEDSILFKESREYSEEVHGVLRLLAGIFSLAIAPLTILGVIGKISLNNVLAEKYFCRRGIDQFIKEDRIANSIAYKFFSLFIKSGKMENLKQSAFIHADKYIEKHSSKILIAKKECQNLRQYSGDLFYRFASIAYKFFSLFIKSGKMENLKQNSFMHSSKSLITKKECQNLHQYGGDLFYRSAKMLRERLEKYRSEKKWGKNVEKALKMVKQYEDLSYKMFSIMPFRFLFIDPSGLIEDLAKDLQDRIILLRNEESFLLPVCLKTSKGFHLITVGIKKEVSGSFTFSVYNVGLGSSHHKEQKNLQGKSYYYPYRVSNISLNNITDMTFLKEFIDHATFKKEDCKGDLFYSFLTNKKWWGSQAEINPKSYKNSLNSSPKSKQISGTCVWRSPLTALKDNMTPASYKAFIYAMKRDDIQDLYKNYLEKTFQLKSLKNRKIKLNQNQKQAVIILKIAIDEFIKRNKKTNQRYENPESDKKYESLFCEIQKSFKENGL